MPACFQMIDKQLKIPVALDTIDNKMRVDFGAELDSVNWFHNWYNAFGFCLACGDTIEKIKENWKDDKVMVDILSWIDKNYTIRYWREVR